MERQTNLLVQLVWEYSRRAELDRALALGEEALELCNKIGDRTYLPTCYIALGDVNLKKGEWEKSEQYYTQALEQSRRLKEFQPVSASYWSLGSLHFEKGEYTKANESFEEARKILKKAGDRGDEIWLYTGLAQALIELNQFEEAQNLISSLQKFALETEEKYLIAFEKALRAMLLRAQKKWEESIALFETATQELDSMNARIWITYAFARWVLCEFARVYLERNQEGDKEKAHNLLNQALEMFQKMGAKKDIEKILAKKKLLTS
jgi:tetratricopeptide (TPR) repeat protein